TRSRLWKKPCTNWLKQIKRSKSCQFLQINKQLRSEDKIQVQKSVPAARQPERYGKSEKKLSLNFFSTLCKSAFNLRKRFCRLRAYIQFLVYSTILFNSESKCRPYF